MKMQLVGVKVNSWNVIMETPEEFVERISQEFEVFQFIQVGNKGIIQAIVKVKEEGRSHHPETNETDSE